MAINYFILTIVLAGLFGINQAVQVEFKDCGSKEANISKVEVEPCEDPKFCGLKKGTSPKISVTFAPKGEVTAVKAVVHGVIRGIPIPFPLPHSDGCTESGLACPIAAGASVTYWQQLEIKSEYPNLVVVVKWELKDQADNDLVCFMLKTRITE